MPPEHPGVCCVMRPAGAAADHSSSVTVPLSSESLKRGCHAHAELSGCLRGRACRGRPTPRVRGRNPALERGPDRRGKGKTPGKVVFLAKMAGEEYKEVTIEAFGIRSVTHERMLESSEVTLWSVIARTLHSRPATEMFATFTRWARLAKQLTAALPCRIISVQRKNWNKQSVQSLHVLQATARRVGRFITRPGDRLVDRPSRSSSS